MARVGLYNVYDDIGAHAPFLYKLLGQRKSWQNISHSKMPLMADHIRFVQSTPYFKWWIIVSDDIKIGHMYLTRQYEIGLFIDKEYQGHGYGSLALKTLLQMRARPVYANINPDNAQSIKFFQKHGFKLHSVVEGVIRQNTYILD